MKAIVRNGFGGPEILAVREVPLPVPGADEVLIRVQAFGLNQAEIHFRKGAWRPAAAISGIECAGTVVHAPGRQLIPGQTVLALVGGMGRDRNGSYAEYACVPAANVAAVNSALPWETLAALPESYATAWSCLHTVLGIAPGQTLLVRGASSALGLAAVNIAVDAGCRVVATTRKPQRLSKLEALGAEHALLDGHDLVNEVRARFPQGLDAALDIVGTPGLTDTLALLRRSARACVAGFLGGGGPLTFEPVFQIPSGRHLSAFASALVLGGADFPLAEIPFQAIVDRAAAGDYHAEPARVFEFDDIVAAHRCLESGEAFGKLVVRLPSAASP
jgi:NADPH:quinone reductase-like Zn-dependent oxidoreductase